MFYSHPCWQGEGQYLENPSSSLPILWAERCASISSLFLTQVLLLGALPNCHWQRQSELVIIRRKI